MRFLTTLMLGVLAFPQEIDPGLERLLERLKGDSLESRDAAQRELSEFIDTDAKAARVRDALGRVDTEIQERLKQALQMFPANKALRLLEKGDSSGLDDLFAAGDDIVPRIRRLLEKAAGNAPVEKACKDVLARIEWTWMAESEKVRIGFRVARGEVVQGGTLPLEVRVINESDRDKVFGNIMEHMHSQFSPGAMLINEKGEWLQVRIRLDSSPLPSQHKGGCEVTLKAGVSAVLKGSIEPITYVDKKPVPPGSYRLRVDLEDFSDLDAPTLPVKVLAKK